MAVFYRGITVDISFGFILIVEREIERQKSVGSIPNKKVIKYFY